MTRRTRYGSGLAACVVACAAIGFAAAAQAAPRSDYPTECANPTQTISTSSSTALDLTPTSVILFTGGTFTGGINAFPQGAVICVDTAATVNPTYMNNAAGHLLSRGTVTLPSTGVNTGFVFDNAGTANLPNGINTNGASALINRAAGTFVVGASMNLSGGAGFLNVGTATFKADLTLNSDTTVDNSGQLTVDGALQVNGDVVNTGHLDTAGQVTTNGQSSVTNDCWLTAGGGYANNGTTTSSGVITVTGTLNNNGQLRQTEPATTAGTGFNNDGTTTGYGQYRFTGDTRTQGTFTGDSAGAPIVFYDTTQTTGQIFDTQSGTVARTIRAPVSPPDAAFVPTGCSQAPTGADLVVSKSGPAVVLTNGSVTYQVSITNAGPLDATGVTVTDTLPAGLTAITASDGGVVSGGTVTWDEGTVPAGTTRIRTITGTAPGAPTTLVDVVAGTSTSSDPDPSNNDGSLPDATVSTEVQAAPPPPNLPPTVTDATITTAADVPAMTVVIANDPDVGQRVRFTRTSGPSHGRTLVLPFGIVVYAPTPGYTGRDSIAVTGCDNGTPVLCDDGTVSITVLPHAGDDTAATTPGTPVSIPVLDNDRGDTSPPVVTSGPADGSVTEVAGELVYSPDAGFTGVDTFTYAICSPTDPDICANAQVSVTVAPPTNLAPTINDDSQDTTEGVTVSGQLTFSDPDGDQVTVALGSGPAHGSAVVNADGSYTYTPDPGFTGVDAFTVTACDDGSPVLCDSAVVTITVRPTPSPSGSDPDGAVDGIADTGSGATALLAALGLALVAAGTLAVLTSRPPRRH